MPLDASVKITESAVAALMGTTLIATNYTIYGLTVSQANFQSVINTTAFAEKNQLGTSVYDSSDPIIANAVKAYQTQDACYRLALSFPGYSATYFSYGVGDESFNPSTLIMFLSAQADRFKVERDKSFNELQSILSGDVMIDTNQPGYSNPASPIY